ncbi:MAG TPA: hypothetical protein VE891_10775 [Allosphingosinicella sp.]|nr:hypothetical protein [Allosphingosinicella sp.]
MSEIDRRTLITAAGAGLLLAGCNSKSEDNVSSGSVKPSTKADALGVKYGGSLSHGQLTTDELPNPMGNVREFDPKYICVLYLRFEAARTLTTRLAYIALTESNPSLVRVEELARPIIHRMNSNQHGTITAVRKEEDLDLFGFSSQQVVVIFVDNDPDLVKFEDGNEDFVVRFTKYSGSNPGIAVNENHAFLNLMPFDLTTATPSGASRAYKLDYWNTDDQGNKIRALHPLSMNIHLKMAVRRTGNQTTHWAPLVVDPDTGNMGSQP